MFNKEIARNKFLIENPDHELTAKSYISHPKVRKDYLTKIALSVSKWRKKYPERNKAHRIVFSAIRNGSLIRKPCEVCNQIYRIEAHHNDYSKPLEIQWLCKRHHVEADKERITSVCQ